MQQPPDVRQFTLGHLSPYMKNLFSQASMGKSTFPDQKSEIIYVSNIYSVFTSKMLHYYGYKYMLHLEQYNDFNEDLFLGQHPIFF